LGHVQCIILVSSRRVKYYYCNRDEVKEADIGLACGGDYAVIFRHGELIKRGKMSEAAHALLQQIQTARKKI